MDVEMVVEQQSSVPNVSVQLNPFDSSSSFSEQISDANEFESQENPEPVCKQNCVSVGTETAPSINPFQRDIQEFFR